MGNPDPEFALRAAALANKAQRKSVNGDRSIDANRTATATITLGVAFIEKLQTMSIGREGFERNARRIDALPIKDAEQLLSGNVIDDVVKIFNES